MGFIQGTQLFTDTGWKNIEDIKGKDRVLVRNFLGDAELIQPFAVKKSHYEGDIIKIGAKDFSFSVTPDHPVVYFERNRNDREKKIPAKDIVLYSGYRVHRKFKFIIDGEPKKEMINVWDEFGRRSVTISHHDWYKLIGYVLMRGFIRLKPGRPMLFLFLEEGRIEEEIAILGDILDRIGVGWHVQYSEKTRPKIVVSSKNTLVARLIYRLGSSRRKEMYLPEKIIYQSTKELAKLLVETIIEASLRHDTERKPVFQLSTTNLALIDTLTLLGTLNGYSMRKVHHVKKGTMTFRGEAKRDSYILQISSPTDTYQPKYKKKLHYSGPIYELDLFEGQIYVKEGSMPVWVDPK